MVSALVLRFNGDWPTRSRTLECSLPFPRRSVGTGEYCLEAVLDQTEKEEPHPQVVDALGLRITNWAPSRSST